MLPSSLSSRLLALAVALGAAACGPKFAYHGNFCGPGYPGPMAASVEDLEKIVPVDQIDAACQQHDICYAVAGSNDALCDMILAGTMKHLVALNRYSFRCRHLARTIERYFAMLHPSVMSGESWQWFFPTVDTQSSWNPPAGLFTSVMWLGKVQHLPYTVLEALYEIPIGIAGYPAVCTAEPRPIPVLPKEETEETEDDLWEDP